MVFGVVMKYWFVCSNGPSQIGSSHSKNVLCVLSSLLYSSFLCLRLVSRVEIEYHV